MEADKRVYDVLIVGAGPSGLMTSVVLCRMGISPFVVDSGGRADPEWGRADVLHSRTLEVMESLGEPFEQIMKMSRPLNNHTFWVSDNGAVKRTINAPFYFKSIDFNVPQPQALRQGLLQEVLLRDAEKHDPAFHVHWGRKFVDMCYQADGKVLEVTLQDVETGKTNVVLAKYVIGADGAKSAVRAWAGKFGVQMEEHPTPDVYWVQDVVGIRSNFPDLERFSVIGSKDGIAVNIPREPIKNQRATRFALQLRNATRERSNHNFATTLNRILAPFTVEWDEVVWTTNYRVTQRLINEFVVDDRVFFLGDACHTHSPRGGLGANTSLLEGHNLGWKIALVLKGIAQPNILSTYATERYAVAYDLIDMDRQLVKATAELSDPQLSLDDDSADSAAARNKRMQDLQILNSNYQSGASIVYSPNLLVAKSPKQVETFNPDAPGTPIGGRTRPALMRRFSDASIVPVHTRFDGRFTIYLLVGDLERQGTVDALLILDDYITSSGSIFTRYGHDTHMEEISVHSRMPSTNSTTMAAADAPDTRQFYTYENDDMPQIDGGYGTRSHPVFRPMIITTTSDTQAFQLDSLMKRASPLGISTSRLLHPSRFFSDDCPALSPFGEGVLQHPVHAKWGVDQGVGATVIVRPDGHVGAYIEGYGIGAWKDLEKYFAQCLI